MKTWECRGRLIAGLMCILLVFLLSSCGFADRMEKEAKETDQKLKAAIKQCQDAGGIPLYSSWDKNVMVDCKFPPKSKKPNDE